jgi:uncharacterized protein YdgA (DUF945 family)
MKKSLVVASAVAAGVAVAFPASSWLLGKQAEAAIGELYRPLADYPDIRIVQREYERGIFGATERVTVELFGKTARALERMQKDAAAQGAPAAPPLPITQPVTFSVRSDVRHGPFPGFAGLGAAIIDSELVVEGEALTKIAQTMGSQNPLRSRTVIDFTGGGVSTLTSPAFSTTVPGQDAGTASRIDWGGVAMKVDFTRAMKSYTIDGEAPRLSIKDATGAEVILTGLRLKADQQRIFDDEPMLYAGRITLALVEIKATSGEPDAEPFLVRQAAYDIRVPVQGEFLDIAAKIGAEVVQVGPQDYGPAHYDFSLNRLHARTVAKFYRTWLKISSDPTFPGAAGKQGNGLAMLAPLAEPAFELLRHNPEVRIDRLSFNSKHGEALLSARARLKDAKPEEFANPLMLMMRLEAGAEAALPEGLVGDLMGGGTSAGDGVGEPDAAAARAEMLRMQLAAFEAQGLVRREGGTIKSKLEFAAGQLKVNGQPFDPSAMGGGPPMVAPPQQ